MAKPRLIFIMILSVIIKLRPILGETRVACLCLLRQAGRIQTSVLQSMVRFKELLRQHFYAIKNQLKALNAPHAGSLWHKGAYNRNLLCMETNNLYTIKNQRGASKKPLVGGFGCDELVLYGIRLLA